MHCHDKISRQHLREPKKGTKNEIKKEKKKLNSRNCIPCSNSLMRVNILIRVFFPKLLARSLVPITPAGAKGDKIKF